MQTETQVLNTFLGFTATSLRKKSIRQGLCKQEGWCWAGLHRANLHCRMELRDSLSVQLIGEGRLHLQEQFLQQVCVTLSLSPLSWYHLSHSHGGCRRDVFLLSSLISFPPLLSHKLSLCFRLPERVRRGSQAQYYRLLNAFHYIAC